MWNNHKKIILLAARAVLSRYVNVNTTKGSYATTDPDTMTNLEAAIVDAFNLDTDEGVQEKDIQKIERSFEPIVQKVIDIDYLAVQHNTSNGPDKLVSIALDEEEWPDSPPHTNGLRGRYSETDQPDSPQENKLYLMLVRGLPGSGKSIFAIKEAKKKGYNHYENDMYHTFDGEYKFDLEEVSRAHEWCKNSTNLALSGNQSTIVSNTFTTNEEMEPYRRIASKQGAKILIVTTKGDYGTIHGVPEDVIKKMKDRWEPLDPIYTEKS